MMDPTTGIPFTRKNAVAVLVLLFSPHHTFSLLSVRVITFPPKSVLSSSFGPFNNNNSLNGVGVVVCRSSSSSSSSSSQIVDAEFGPVVPETSKAAQQIWKEDDDDDNYSLLNLSLKADPEIGDLRIPFVYGEQVMDAKLAFMTQLDGVSYGIGIPYDFAAAITLEKKDGSIENISPDLDENTELMELMAGQLHEHVGNDLQLIRSPRILTISGPLDKYTENWQEDLLPKSIDTEALLNDDDEDVQSFLKFMKEELGEEEFTKTMNEEHTFDDDVLALFSVPGLGDKEDDLADFLREEMEGMSSSSLDEDEYANRQQNMMEDVVGKIDLAHDGVALKLVSYYMPDGKRYSLVKLLKPVVLVAKEIKTADKSTPRFELLSPEEHRMVSPRLEEVCRAELEQIGIDLDG